MAFNTRKIFLILAVAVAVLLVFLLVRELYAPQPLPENGTSAQELVTVYIHPIDWPPAVQVVDGPFECTEAGEETARAGQTERRVINGHTYCMTKVTEGAAGSVYTQYAYAAPRGDTVEIYTFSLRFEQCGNYSELQKTMCEEERASFDIDGVIDDIVGSI